MDESHLDALRRLDDSGVERSRSRHLIDHDQRQGSRLVRASDLLGQLVGLLARRLGRRDRLGRTVPCGQGRSVVVGPRQLRDGEVLRPVVDGPKAPERHRRAHPHRPRARRGAEGVAQPLELSARGQPRAHELNLVEHPQTIAVEETKMNRPEISAHRVTAIERTRQELILRTHQHQVAIDVALPGPIHGATHEDVDTHLVGETEIGDRSLSDAGGLFDQGAHRQAQHESPRRRRPRDLVRLIPTAPQPTNEDRRGLAGAGRCLHDVRELRGGRERDLIREGPWRGRPRRGHRGPEQVVEGGDVHRSCPGVAPSGDENGSRDNPPRQHPMSGNLSSRSDLP
jgi:hypothetical protein